MTLIQGIVMANFKQKHRVVRIQRSLLATVFIASGVHAQQDAQLKPVVINDRNAALQADVSGFGDVPLRELPLSITVAPAAQLQQAGVRRLADITRLDASTTDSYNAAGYWDFLTVRGYTLNNRTNFRREGLPISAETSIPLDNKDRIEIFKGTSGIQAGTSAPGGLVNYAVKRPTNQPLRSARVELSDRGSVLGAVDLGGRFGVSDDFGYRLNVAHENLRPALRAADGSRSLLALATDWRLGTGSILEAEIEWSRRSQPSQAAFSLLGNVLPAPVNPRINLNNQPWSLPVVFEGLTGTVRFEQALGTDWRWSVQAGSQRLKTDDRIAFPFGCSAEGNFDRFCSDSTYDLYDFRSEGERRTQQAVKLAVNGRVTTGALRHDLQAGLLRSQSRERYNQQAFNFVGTGNVQGTGFTAPDPTLTGESTNRDERSTELFVTDSISWNAWRASMGVRHSRIDRESVRTDGSQALAYQQNFTTPWLGLAYTLGNVVLYGSAGEGIESVVVPQLPQYGSAAGQPLPAVKSRQWELGARGGDTALAWGVSVFNIVRPAVADTGTAFQFDGDARHRGIEAKLGGNSGAWRWATSAMWLDAALRGSTLNPAANGLKPVNVPSHTLRAEAAWRIPGAMGVELDARLTREGSRAVLANNTLTLRAWNRLDAGLSYATTLGAAKATWRVAVDNLTDRRYWRESPTQFGHIFLYPGAPRTLRVSLEAAL